LGVGGFLIEENLMTKKQVQVQSIKGERLIGKVPVMYFQDGKQVVAFSPALDLSTCGDTKEQARTRFIEAATIFLDEIIEMGTVDDVLTECGWKKTTVNDKSSWTPPVYSQELVKIAEGSC
jgi:hypothetical protein